MRGMRGAPDMGLAGPQRAQLAGQKRPYHSGNTYHVHIRRSAPQHSTTTPWSSCRRLGPRCHIMTSPWDMGFISSPGSWLWHAWQKCFRSPVNAAELRSIEFDHLWPERPAHAARPAFRRRDRTEQESHLGRNRRTRCRHLDDMSPWVYKWDGPPTSRPRWPISWTPGWCGIPNSQTKSSTKLRGAPRPSPPWEDGTTSRWRGQTGL